MNRVVLDASALITVLLKEPGSEMLTGELLVRSMMSAVNLAEVQTRLVRAGDDPTRSWTDAISAISGVEPFTSAQAKLAGNLVTHTRILGLSLGDRACLALAISVQAPVYTADQIWQKLDIGVPIHVIR